MIVPVCAANLSEVQTQIRRGGFRCPMTTLAWPRWRPGAPGCMPPSAGPLRRYRHFFQGKTGRAVRPQVALVTPAKL